MLKHAFYNRQAEQFGFSYELHVFQGSRTFFMVSRKRVEGFFTLLG